jgi:hypothetical protein
MVSITSEGLDKECSSCVEDADPSPASLDILACLEFVVVVDPEGKSVKGLLTSRVSSLDVNPSVVTSKQTEESFVLLILLVDIFFESSIMQEAGGVGCRT